MPLVDEGHPVAAVLRWKCVKGKLFGLVRRQPDPVPVSGEFPPEWRGESDLGADLVREGRAPLRFHDGAGCTHTAHGQICRCGSSVASGAGLSAAAAAAAGSADTGESGGSREG